MKRKMMERFTAQQVEDLKRALLSRQHELAEIEDHLEHEAFVQDKEDPAAEDVALTVASEELGELQQIEAALQRIEDGEYGHCEECDAEIPFQRLTAMAETRWCAKCKGAAEADARRRSGGTVRGGTPSIVDPVRD